MPNSDLDLTGIDTRAKRAYLEIGEVTGVSIAPSIFDHFNTDVPALLAEVERLRHDLAISRKVSISNKHHHSEIFQRLERVEALTKDTDGGDVDPDAEIPVGEIRRALDEPIMASRPYVAPGMPAGAPERDREIAETMPTVGQWPGSEGGADRG